MEYISKYLHAMLHGEETMQEFMGAYLSTKKARNTSKEQVSITFRHSRENSDIARELLARVRARRRGHEQIVLGNRSKLAAEEWV
jgi:hypothetical protein